MARRNKTFTIYDRLEENGYFDSNPANVDSRGPHGEQIHKRQDFPKMVFHPKGQYRVTNPGEYIGTVMGPKLVGVQSELIFKIVENPDELAEALAEGWHKTPAASVASSVGGVPNMPELAAAAQNLIPASTSADVALAEANRKINEMMIAMTTMQATIAMMASAKPAADADLDLE